MLTKPLVPPSRGLVDISELLARITPTLRARVFRKSVSANKEILPAALMSNYPASMFRIIVALRDSTVLKAVHSGEELYFNSNEPLVARALYTFDLPVAVGDMVNFRAEDATLVLLLVVTEIGGYL